MISIRADFNSSIESLALREEAAHARSRIWDKNPEATFNLDGKILTKPSGTLDYERENLKPFND